MKVKVPVFGTVGKSVAIEADAPSRTEVAEQIAAAIQNIAATPTPGVTTVIWRFIREIPANIANLAAFTGAGLLVRLSNSSYVARSVAVANTARLTVSNADGTGGNPTLDMADIDSVSVWGRSANSSGKPAAIQAAANDRLLARTADALTFRQLTVGMVPDAELTYAKIQAVSAASKLLGRGGGGGAGVAQEITLGSNLSMTGTTLNANIGAVTFIAQASVAGAAATTLTVSGLDLATDEEYLISLDLANATGSAANIALFFNSDTTATNYDSQGMSVDGTVATAARANDARVTTLAAVSGSPASAQIRIRRGVDDKVHVWAETNRGVTTAMIFQIFTTTWRTTATNVTGITISSSVASSLAIGSNIRVFRRHT